MPSDKNPGEIRNTDLTQAQLESASEFLALLGWKDNEPSRKTKRVDIARIVAWYGALRFQSAFYRTTSLENPSRLIETTPSLATGAHIETEEVEFEIIEITDLQLRPLLSNVS